MVIASRFGPIIEVESVRSALDAMRNAEPLGTAHPLSQFLSIRPYTLGGAAGSDSAIFGHLSQIIRRRLARHREVQHIETISSGPEQLSHDFQANSDELQAWSMLYYRYVRVDLDLSYEKLEVITRQPKRTLTRRQSKGINRLTYDLARHETKIRLQQREAALRTQLPLPFAPPLIGRKPLLNEIVTRLTEPDLPRHVLLYGAPGIGKSSLALAAAHQLVDQGAIQNVVWLDKIAPDQLVEQIALRLGLIQGQHIGTHLQMVDTLIVLDNIFTGNPELLGVLGAARLIMCANHAPTTDITTIHVPDLDQDSALNLMSRESQRQRQNEKLDFFSQLYAEFGGNPGALKAALHGGKYYDPAQITAGLFDWNKLSTLAKLLWLILALSESCTETALYALLQEFSGATVKQTLLQLHHESALSKDPHELIMLTPLARAFAQQILQDGTERALVHSAVGRWVDWALAQHNRPQLLFLLAALHDADIGSQMRLDLVYALAPVVEHSGAWTLWRSTLSALYDTVRGQDHAWVGLHLGIAYRWLAQWTEAAYLLAEVIDEAGRIGDFETQADAMIELAAVERYQGQRDSAAKMIERAARYYRRQKLSDSLERAAVELIQLSLDTGDLKSALRQFNEIAAPFEKSPRVWNVQALLAMHTNDLDLALEAALQAQRGLQSDLPRLARAITLLGQIHYRRGDWRAAIDHLLSAMAIMEQTGDQLGHARARMNLAAVFIGQGNLRSALSYLRDLPDELERLEDVESLQAASQNLEMLNNVARRWRNNRMGS
jgi:tetratricopeptide (TPR) repeat protein